MPETTEAPSPDNAAPVIADSGPPAGIEEIWAANARAAAADERHPSGPPSPSDEEIEARFAKMALTIAPPDDEKKKSFARRATWFTTKMAGLIGVGFVFSGIWEYGGDTANKAGYVSYKYAEAGKADGFKCKTADFFGAWGKGVGYAFLNAAEYYDIAPEYQAAFTGGPILQKLVATGAFVPNLIGGVVFSLGGTVAGSFSSPDQPLNNGPTSADVSRARTRPVIETAAPHTCG